jgi:hypothetical protein
MSEVQAGTETQLEDVAVGLAQHRLPVLGHERIVQQEVAQARKDYPGIETHR